MDSQQIKTFLIVFIGGLIAFYILWKLFLKIFSMIGSFIFNVKRERKRIKTITPKEEKSKYSSGVLPKEMIEKIEYGAKLANQRFENKEEEEEEEEEEETNEFLNTKPLEREILSHEIMTKGVFMFENKKGEHFEVFGQRHTLFSETQTWDEENEEWDEGDKEEIDDFHLTDYEKGYQFSEDDLCKFFEIDDWPDWDYNGFSTDWCGIEDDDDNETRQKKWDDYKAKFPKATSIKHFDIENKKS